MSYNQTVEFSTNGFRFKGSVSRSGDTLTIKNVTVTPKYGVNSLESGWTFKVWINGVEKGSKHMAYWVAGSNSGSGYLAGETDLFSSVSGTASAGSSATVKIGVERMLYNGKWYSNVTTSQSYASIAVTPSVPTISVSFDDSTAVAYKGVNAYRYQNPVINVTAGSNTTHTRYALEWKYIVNFSGIGDNSGWSSSGQANNGSWQSGSISQRMNFGTDWRGCVGRVRADALSSTSTASDWTGWKYFIINDLPGMDNTGISLDRSIATGEGYVKASWWKSSDLAAAGKNYKIHLDKWENNNYVYKQTIDNLGDVTEKGFNLSSYGFSRGNWCRVRIVPGDSLEWSGTSYGHKEVRYNSLPTIKGSVSTDHDGDNYKSTFKDSMSVTSPVIEGLTDNESGTYYFYYRTGSSTGSYGNWIHFASSGNRTVNFDSNNKVSKGNYVQIGVIVSDGYENSGNTPGATSKSFRRDNNPGDVSGIKIEPTLTGNDVHFESISKISWNAVNGQNGTACSYRVGVEVRANTNSGIHHQDSITTNSTNTTWDITNLSKFPRSYLFKFYVVAIDMFDLESSPTWTRWYRKNRKPNVVPAGTFKTNSQKTNFYQTVPLKWSAASDDDGDTLTYKIFFSRNRSAFTEIASNISALTYTHDIKNLNAGDTLGYKIVAVDKHGIQSEETLIDKCHTLFVNTPPNAPKFIYPVSAVYDTEPRILFNTLWDTDKDTLNVIAVVNGVTYNSATSPKNFNYSTYNGDSGLNQGNKGIFIPNKLPVGSHVVKLKVYDGMQYSTEVQTTITIKTPTLLAINNTADVFVSKDVYDKFGVMINEIRSAYGIGNFNFPAVTKDNSFVTATHYNNLLNKACDVNSWINDNYDGLSRPKTKPPISKNNLISRGIYNSILDVITNL